MQLLPALENQNSVAEASAGHLVAARTLDKSRDNVFAVLKACAKKSGEIGLLAENRRLIIFVSYKMYTLSSTQAKQAEIEASMSSVVRN
jgi:hypothetical protein